MRILPYSSVELSPEKKRTLIITACAVMLVILIFLFLRAEVDRHTRLIHADLATFYNEGVSFTMPLRQTIPLELTLPVGELIDFNRLLPDSIPFQGTVPINTSVRINQTLQVPVNLPIVGSTVVDVPLDTTLPIDMNIPVNTEIALNIGSLGMSDQVIQIDQEIDVRVPIEISVSAGDLGVERSLRSASTLINTLRFFFLLRSLGLD